MFDEIRSYISKFANGPYVNGKHKITRKLIYWKNGQMCEEMSNYSPKIEKE